MHFPIFASKFNDFLNIPKLFARTISMLKFRKSRQKYQIKNTIFELKTNLIYQETNEFEKRGFFRITLNWWRWKKIDLKKSPTTSLLNWDSLWLIKSGAAGGSRTGLFLLNALNYTTWRPAIPFRCASTCHKYLCLHFLIGWGLQKSKPLLAMASYQFKYPAETHDESLTAPTS